MSFFTNLKLRFILGGCIVAVIGVVLLFIRGDIGIVLIVIGIIALVIGIFWKRKVKPDDKSTD